MSKPLMTIPCMTMFYVAFSSHFETQGEYQNITVFDHFPSEGETDNIPFVSIRKVPVETMANTISMLARQSKLLQDIMRELDNSQLED